MMARTCQHFGKKYIQFYLFSAVNKNQSTLPELKIKNNISFSLLTKKIFEVGQVKKIYHLLKTTFSESFSVFDLKRVKIALETTLAATRMCEYVCV